MDDWLKICPQCKQEKPEVQFPVNNFYGKPQGACLKCCNETARIKTALSHVHKPRKKWKLGHWEKGHYITNGSRGYWSKYGGGEKWREPEETSWYCQSCNREQISVMPSYKMRLNSLGDEYVRVCPLCKHTSLLKEILIFVDLIEIIRPHGKFSNAIANLLSLPLRY